MRKVSFVILTLTLTLSSPHARADDEAQLRKKVERLEAENEALKDQNVKLRKELTELRMKLTLGAPRTSLSDRLPQGAILRGDFVTTNMGKDNVEGKAMLTVLERKDNTIKASMLATANGKPNQEAEVVGKINGNSIEMKSVSAPNPFTLSGSLKDDYLTLLYVGKFSKARVKLKVE